MSGEGQRRRPTRRSKLVIDPAVQHGILLRSVTLDELRQRPIIRAALLARNYPER